MKSPIVLVLPGILGSDLSDTERGGYGAIWLDPVGIVAGQLAQLELSADGQADANPRVRIEATGIFESHYGDLVRALRRRDFDARPYFFDWRRDIARTAARLANVIADEMPVDTPLFLVAHSMGGLVSRRLFQAHPAAAARVRRLVMLGTPNFGSFSPVQVFSGEEPLLGWVAALDLRNSKRKLIEVFRSFRGLVQMLPARAKFTAVDFFASKTWGVRAFAEGTLVRARRFQEELENDRSTRNRYSLIAGYGRETVTNARKLDAGEFEFLSSEKGDGTVPLHLCLLEGATTYFTRAKHGAMAAEGEVIEAVCDLLQGRGVALRTSAPLVEFRAAERRYVTPPPPELPGFLAGVRTRAQRRERIRKLTSRQRAELEGKTAQAHAAFLAPPEEPRRPRAKKKEEMAAIAPAPAASRRRLLLKTALGSVANAPAGTVVLGVYPGVRPQGSLAAVDREVGGYISQLCRQGAIHGGVGEVLFLPTRGAAIPAEMVVLVGLGEARFFDHRVLRRVGENLARALVQIRVNQMATVAIGSGSSSDLTDSLRALLEGFLIGLDAADPDHLFRAITFCEIDDGRLGQLQGILRDSVAYWSLRGVELEVKEAEPLPKPPAEARDRRYQELSYWIESAGAGFRYFLLGDAANPALEGPEAKLGEHVRELQAAMESPPLSNGRKVAAQRRFARELLRSFPAELRQPLKPGGPFTHATINLAQAAAPMAWELLPIAGGSFGLGLSVSRRLTISADHRPVASYLPSHREQRRLRVAIVADPTGDLEGARAEGKALDVLLRGDSRFEVRSFIGSAQCSEALVRDLIDAGKVDVLHYAGHGEYDADRPERSGLVLNGERDGLLTAREVRESQRPPLLVFANACQVGIVGLGPTVRDRKRVPQKRTREWRRVRARQPFGFAEALLQAGVRAYVGTFWNIPDRSAEFFARAFYRSLAQGLDLGEAMRSARRATHARDVEGRWAWASYMLYGPGWLTLTNSA